MQDTGHLRHVAPVWHPYPNTREEPLPIHMAASAAGGLGLGSYTPNFTNVHSPESLHTSGARAGGLSPPAAGEPGGVFGGRVPGMKLASEAGGSGGNTPRNKFIVRRYKMDDGDESSRALLKNTMQRTVETTVHKCVENHNKARGVRKQLRNTKRGELQHFSHRSNAGGGAFSPGNGQVWVEDDTRFTTPGLARSISKDVAESICTLYEGVAGAEFDRCNELHALWKEAQRQVSVREAIIQCRDETIKELNENLTATKNTLAAVTAIGPNKIQSEDGYQMMEAAASVAPAVAVPVGNLSVQAEGGGDGGVRMHQAMGLLTVSETGQELVTMSPSTMAEHLWVVSECHKRLEEIESRVRAAESANKEVNTKTDNLQQQTCSVSNKLNNKTGFATTSAIAGNNNEAVPTTTVGDVGQIPQIPHINEVAISATAATAQRGMINNRNPPTEDMSPEGGISEQDDNADDGYDDCDDMDVENNNDMEEPIMTEPAACQECNTGNNGSSNINDIVAAPATSTTINPATTDAPATIPPQPSNSNTNTSTNTSKHKNKSNRGGRGGGGLSNSHGTLAPVSWAEVEDGSVGENECDGETGLTNGWWVGADPDEVDSSIKWPRGEKLPSKARTAQMTVKTRKPRAVTTRKHADDEDDGDNWGSMGNTPRKSSSGNPRAINRSSVMQVSKFLQGNKPTATRRFHRDG